MLVLVASIATSGCRPGPTATASLAAGTAGLPAMACQLPDLTMDNPGQTRFVNTAVDCLDRAWQPVLRAAGTAASRPQVVVFDQAIAACEGELWEPGRGAHYCPSSRTIYWPTTDPSVQELSSPEFLFIVMHEYGHHIQHLQDTSQAGDQLEPDSEQWLQFSRRLELQAQCFAGMATAAAEQGRTLSRDQAWMAVDAQGEVGDVEEGRPRDHGSGESSKRWSQIGYQQNTLAACDTWRVAPSEVS